MFWGALGVESPHGGAIENKLFTFKTLFLFIWDLLATRGESVASLYLFLSFLKNREFSNNKSKLYILELFVICRGGIAPLWVVPLTINFCLYMWDVLKDK